MSFELIFNLGKKVLDGGQLTFDEAMQLTKIEEDDIPLLIGVANKVRAKFTGNQVDTCEIINARSGCCSEDCKYCAQSAYHSTNIETYPLLPEDKIVEAAKQAETDGAYRFCIVTAGCGMKNDPDFTKITAAIKRIGEETDTLQRCCSLGILGEDQVSQLKEAGITRYHHNLETSRSYFGTICTTHTYEDRIQTIKYIKAAGLQVCSGGIIGMGETWQQRVELAYTLKELDVESVPINVLNPVKGTALENQAPLSPMEVLKTIAIFRLILPNKILRYAGGREKALGDLVPLGILAGINGMLIGNYLTTPGKGPQADLDMVRNLGMQPIADQTTV